MIIIVFLISSHLWKNSDVAPIDCAHSSMVLLEVNLPRVAVAPLKRNAPRTVDVKGVALRLALERMEVEAGNVEIPQRRSLLQRIQSPKRPLLEVRRHSSAPTLAKQFF